MSCETQTNRIAHLVARTAAGISRLASKRSFYAGVAVGAMGTGGLVLAVAGLRRRRRPAWRFVREDGPAEGSRANPRPLPGLEKVRQSGRPAEGTRARPRPIPGLAKGQAAPGSRANPRKLNIGSRRPAAGPVRLAPAAVTVATKSGPHTVQEAYRVLGADGRETGLAVTRAVTETGEGLRPGRGWVVTHLVSGGQVEGPFETVEQARQLAEKLTELDWTGPRLSPEAMARAVEIIEAHKRDG